MLTILSLTGALLGSPLATPATANEPRILTHESTTAGDPRAIKVIRMWLKRYRRGNWDLAAATQGSRRSPWGRGGGRGRGAPAPKVKKIEYLIEKHNLVPGRFLGQVNYITEIDQLCQQARETGTVDAARAILEVAAVSLDTRVKYTSKMLPATVRTTGERHLRRMRKAEITAFLATAAAGNPGGSSTFKRAMQAAALRALGARRSSDHRQVMIDQLAVNDPMVRAAAANALGILREGYAIKPLAERLAREGHSTVLIEILSAIERIRTSNSGDAIKVEWMQMAVIEAGRALGRADTWRPDLAIVDFLERFRYRDSIPLLISLLERYVNEKQMVKSGRLSGRLRIRAHEVLTKLTGARIPMTAPAKWREFWNTNRDGFKLAKQSKDSPRSDGKGTQGFFNIPVQGKRIVFVIDVSGSMQRPMRTTDRRGGTRAGGTPARGAPKITIAKQELWSAVKSLPADTRFNVIHYNHEVGRWQKGLVFATDKNKTRFKTWLDRLRAAGNTNIYDAMKLALKMKSLVYGQHYDSEVDEVFLLSDGLPNTGEVTNPSEILRIITETNKFSRVRINTVYLEDNMGGRGGRGGRGGFGRGGGGGGGLSGAELMKQLAAKNGGKFVRP